MAAAILFDACNLAHAAARELCKEADGTLSAVHMLGLSSAVCDEINSIVAEEQKLLEQKRRLFCAQ